MKRDAKIEFRNHIIRSPVPKSSRQRNRILDESTDKTGFSGLLMETGLSSLQYDYISRVAIAGESLLRIINNILDFSKIEAGKLDMEMSLFKLDNVIGNSIQLFQQKAEEKGLKLLLDLSLGLPCTLYGDPFRLGQVITNLLGNAIKFTEYGSVTLGVEFHEQTEGDVKLLFSVRDTGIGLAPEAASMLFTPFTQAEKSTTRRFGGTGLGLSISKQLVKMMDGEIWCESKPGVGSTFNFTARFNRVSYQNLSNFSAEAFTHDSTTQKNVQISPAKVENCNFQDFSKVRILLVDDDEVNRHLTSVILEKKGIMIDMATNGSEAVDKITSGLFDYDLVLMDAQMPEMDGYEATRQIRKNNQFAKLPIIALTSCAFTEELQKSLDAGMNEHISKPISAHNLFSTISRFIQQ